MLANVLLHWYHALYKESIRFSINNNFNIRKKWSPVVNPNLNILNFNRLKNNTIFKNSLNCVQKMGWEVQKFKILLRYITIIINP